MLALVVQAAARRVLAPLRCCSWLPFSACRECSWLEAPASHPAPLLLQHLLLLLLLLPATNHCVQALPVFLASGFAPFQREYEARSLLLHRRVRFRVDDAGTTTVTGRVASLGADGMMYIEEDGEGEAGAGEGDRTAASGAAAPSSSAASAAARGSASAGTGKKKVRGFLTGEVSGVELLDGTGTFVEGAEPADGGGDGAAAAAAGAAASGGATAAHTHKA